MAVAVKKSVQSEKGVRELKLNDSQYVAVASNSALSCIFKLNVDCFEEVFEWLSLTDLKALRQTCKRFKTIIDYCITTNFPALRIGHGIVEIFDWTEPRHIDTNYIKKIHFSNRCEFRSDLAEIENILSKVESVKVEKDQISGEFYGKLLKFCKNLTHLSIANIYDHIIIGSDNRWLLRSYPALEHIVMLENSPGIGLEIVELKTFFELNPTIRTFTTTVQFLQRNGRCLKEANIKLDQLNVFCNKPIQAILNLLNELSQNIQHLHLFGSYSTIRTEDLPTLRALEKLNYARVDRLVLPPLQYLKEFSIGKVEKTANLMNLAKSLTNVNRVHIEEGTLKNVAAFICHSPTVKHIKINRLNGGFIYNIRHIDLAELNKERKKLTGARKINIYVAEEFYLSVKWSGLYHSFSLVELRRSTSREWKNLH